jgi:predicted nucleic acid-binding protein
VRIYIDTSVINGLYAQDLRIREVTEDFFCSAKFGKFILYSSNLSAEEIRKTKNITLRQKLINILEEYQIELLPISEEVEQLAQNYIKEKIIPSKYIADAMHIAFATIHNIPVLVSWNFEHIVKHKTRMEVNRVNKQKGYPQIDICSPEEV